MQRLLPGQQCTYVVEPKIDGLGVALLYTRGVLTRDFRGEQVVGNGTDVDVLRRAGIEKADGFVAVTEGDNRNIMASQIAKHVFKVPHVVTRIYDPERAETYEKLGVHTICPTIEGAKHIARVLMERT